MRICFICLGGFRHIAPYLDYFKEAGHDVHFIALSHAPDYGVKTYNVGFGRKYSRTRGKWKYPFSMLRAKSLINRLKPDIVHTHYATSGGLTGLVCGFHPTVVTVHGSDLNFGLRSPIWQPLLKAIFNHADCVNTVSEDLKRKAIGLGVSPEKICVLTLGVDTEKFSFSKRREIASGRPLRLVNTRHLEKVYDHFTIIKALAIVRSKGINFDMTFVAPGSLLNKLKEQVARKGLADCVNFLGGVGKNEVVDILRNNDVFLSTPLWDGISVALLEAMATGLFPIVSDIDVNSDWIEHGVDGLLHKVGDANDLANCILKVRDDPQLVANAAQHNRKRVVKSGDTKTNMKLLQRIYEELIYKSRRGTV